MRHVEDCRATQLRAGSEVDFRADVERLRTTTVPLPVVDEHHRGDRRTWIADEPSPRVNTLIESHRWTTACAVAAEHVTDATQRPAEMQAPLVLERSVEIGVESPLDPYSLR